MFLNILLIWQKIKLHKRNGDVNNEGEEVEAKYRCIKRQKLRPQKLNQFFIFLKQNNIYCVL